MHKGISVLEELTTKKIAELKLGVVEVKGKAMNRTALGVVDALFTLYPDITFAELKGMLPDNINPSAPKNYKSLFKPYTNRPYGVIQSGDIRNECAASGLDPGASHFIEPNETFRTSDGVEVLVSKSWESSDTETGENDLQNLINHVAQYGIRVTKVEKNQAFNKGSYDLKIINPTLFHELQNSPKQKNKWLVGILLLGALILLALLWFFSNRNEKPEVQPVEPPVQTEVVLKDENEDRIASLTADIAAGIQTKGRSLNFHEIQFGFDSDQLTTESFKYMDEVLQAMQEIAELKVDIVGHTSNEGRDDYNMDLSLKRAEAVASYLTEKGIEATRLSVSGQGSKAPVADNASDEGKELNRRIEFIIADDGN
jgi:outer membrane protein OmpA-like peptidoglycan-associated protein